MDRKEDFKSGLGSTKDVTKRHVEKQHGIRKKKRENKLGRFRHVDAGQGGSAFEIALKEYNPRALYGQKDVFALDALEKCMRAANDEQMNKYFTYLLAYSDKRGSPIIPILVQLLGQENGTLGMKAMSCLVNVTGANLEPQYQPLLAQLIIEAQFLDAVTAHIIEDTVIAKECWYVIANLISLCETSRDVVLSCVLFKNVYNDETWRSPFLGEMQRGRPEYDVLIFTVVCGAFETGMVSLPDPAFCFATLLYVIKYLVMHWHTGKRESTAEPDRVLALGLSALAHFAEKCSSQNLEHVTLFARLFGQAEEKIQGFSFLVNLATRVNTANQRRLARIFVKAGKFNDSALAMQTLMYKAGCLDLMIRFVEEADPRLQREGLMWLGNYASDSLQFAIQIKERDGFKVVSQRLRRAPTHDLRNGAVYCLMQACNICSNALPQERAEQTLVHLVYHCNIIQITCQHLGDLGDPQLTIDILELWLTLLRKWNTSSISLIIEEHGGQDKVEQLLGVTGPEGMRIFKLAEQVLDILSSGPMDFEITNKGHNKFHF